MLRKGRHQVPRDLLADIASRPDKETIGDLFDLALVVLDNDNFVLDFFHHGLGLDGDVLLLEGRFGVLDEFLLNEGRQYDRGRRCL